MTIANSRDESRTAKASLVLSVADAAQALGVSDDLVYDLIHQGVIPCLKFGRRKVIPRVAIASVIEQALDGFNAEVLLGKLRRPQ